MMLGPFKGYFGKVSFDADNELLHGSVLGLRDVVTFQAKTAEELPQAFRDSVDEYLAFCHECGRKPEKPAPGKFVVRMDPELHRQLALLAERMGKSLNRLVVGCLKEKLAEYEDPERLLHS
jgi:predicted HicB family RNase H-like nuclease